MRLLSHRSFLQTSSSRSKPTSLRPFRRSSGQLTNSAFALPTLSLARSQASGTSRKQRVAIALYADCASFLAFPFPPLSLSPPAATLTRLYDNARGHSFGYIHSPAQPDAHAWRAAITISDLVTAKALLAASPSSSAPPLSSALRQALPVNPTPSSATNPLEPYQPSPAHLLLSADVEAPAALVEALAPPPPPRATAAPSLSDEVDGTTSLAKYLCYACLLVLQEPTTTALKPRPGAAKTVDLPPYVSEAVRARQTLEEQEREVVEMKTVKGEEALRREVGEFLLEE